MSDAETASQELVVEVDEASLNASLFKVRSLMFEVNSVRNLAMDVERMASQPSVANAYWLGIQAAMTARRAGNIGETLGSLGEAAGALGAFAATPMGALTVGAVAAAAVVGGLALSDWDRRQYVESWRIRNEQIAKQQGLQP